MPFKIANGVKKLIRKIMRQKVVWMQMYCIHIYQSKVNTNRTRHLCRFTRIKLPENIRDPHSHFHITWIIFSIQKTYHTTCYVSFLVPLVIPIILFALYILSTFSEIFLPAAFFSVSHRIIFFFTCCTLHSLFFRFSSSSSRDTFSDSIIIISSIFYRWGHPFCLHVLCKL